MNENQSKTIKNKEINYKLIEINQNQAKLTNINKNE